jgi:hypothetical protein
LHNYICIIVTFSKPPVSTDGFSLTLLVGFAHFWGISIKFSTFRLKNLTAFPERLTIGTFGVIGVIFMSADLNSLERAIFFLVAVICTIVYGAGD